MLVFSKTSFQARRISPQRPRAVYFTDDVAVAWVPGADDVEIAGLDPAHGPRFYTLTVAPAGRPAIAPADGCLHCHLGPNTDGVAGLYVGSVVPGPGGAPLRDQTAIVTDHRTPFAERYGGWYVNARRGEPRSRANALAVNPADPETLVREVPQNLPSLMGVVNTAGYPAPASDLVALLVFEHQTRMTNLLTRVAWEARMAAAGGPPAAAASLDADVEDVVRYLVFSGEARLDGPVEGASTFAAAFAARGPKDARGRSLRDFHLKTRVFRHPLSYTITARSSRPCRWSSAGASTSGSTRCCRAGTSRRPSRICQRQTVVRCGTSSPGRGRRCPRPSTRPADGASGVASHSATYLHGAPGEARRQIVKNGTAFGRPGGGSPLVTMVPRDTPRSPDGATSTRFRAPRHRRLRPAGAAGALADERGDGLVAEREPWRAATEVHRLASAVLRERRAQAHDLRIA